MPIHIGNTKFLSAYLYGIDVSPQSAQIIFDRTGIDPEDIVKVGNTIILILQIFCNKHQPLKSIGNRHRRPLPGMAGEKGAGLN